MACAWKNFKIIFSRPLFIIIFRPKIVFLDKDSILRVKTTIEKQDFVNQSFKGEFEYWFWMDWNFVLVLCDTKSRFTSIFCNLCNGLFIWKKSSEFNNNNNCNSFFNLFLFCLKVAIEIQVSKTRRKNHDNLDSA